MPSLEIYLLQGEDHLVIIKKKKKEKKGKILAGREVDGFL